MFPQQVERFIASRMYGLYADLLANAAKLDVRSVDYYEVRRAIGENMKKFLVECMTPEESRDIATIACTLANSVEKANDVRDADNLKELVVKFRERGQYWFFESRLGD